MEISKAKRKIIGRKKEKKRITGKKKSINDQKARTNVKKIDCRPMERAIG